MIAAASIPIAVWIDIIWCMNGRHTSYSLDIILISGKAKVLFFRLRMKSLYVEWTVGLGGPRGLKD